MTSHPVYKDKRFEATRLGFHLGSFHEITRRGLNSTPRRIELSYFSGLAILVQVESVLVHCPVPRLNAVMMDPGFEPG